MTNASEKEDSLGILWLEAYGIVEVKIQLMVVSMQALNIGLG